MKSRIMRKLFIGNLLIFSALLLMQLVFQSMFFEPFLTREQSKRLQKQVNSVQTSIEKEDDDQVRRKINEGIHLGMVVVAVDENMNQMYGQNIEQFQHCFTVEDEQGVQYSIVEDYLESEPLQTMRIGDEVSIDGYLVDERNALVIPSQISRTEDGVVLGMDTFLLVDSSKGMRNEKISTPSASEGTEADLPKTGIAITQGDRSDSPEKGLVMNEPPIDPDNAWTAPQTAMDAVPFEVNVGDTNPSGTDTVPFGQVPDEPDESALPQGFHLYTPDDAKGGEVNMNSIGISTADQSVSSTLHAKRLLIIDGDASRSQAYPISIRGKIVDEADLSHSDLQIQQSLINDEIRNRNTTKSVAASTYSITTQLTTGKYMLCVSRLADSQTTVIGAISLYSIKDMNGLMNTFHILFFIVELALFIGAIYFFSRMITKPLVEMNDIARKIARQDFTSRVNVASKDEVGFLGTSINAISTNLEQKINQINDINDHLQQDYERQLDLQRRHKHLSASFSHELKTPLTIVRGYIDSMQSGVYPKDQAEYYGIVLRELDSAGKMITQMLEVEKMESPYFTLIKSTVDLWMVFFKVYDELKPTVDQRGLHVQYHAEDEANTIADAEWLEMVISNALTNAIKYSPPGSRITVQITTAKELHTFRMENENASIPSDDLEKIWQPFYRGDKAQANATATGTGLGMTIISDILNAHGFTYGIRNTRLGVEFFFSCPALTQSNE